MYSVNKPGKGNYHSIQMLDTITKSGGDLLSSLLAPVYTGAADVNPVEEAEKRREKKKKSQDQSMGLSR